MTLPIEFQKFDGISFCSDEQVNFYRNQFSEPFAYIYRGMGTYWVICKSLTNNSKYDFHILGGPNNYHRDENHDDHLKNAKEPSMSAKECADQLENEISKF